MKRILLLSISAIVVVFVVYLFFQYRKNTVPSTNIIEVIPEDAALIFYSPEIRRLWNKVHETNLMWQDLITITSFENLNNELLYLDSLFLNDQIFTEYGIPENFMMSMHGDEAGVHHNLFVVTASMPLNESQISDYIIKKSGDTGPSVRKISDRSIYSIKTERGALSYYIYNNLLVASFSASLTGNSLNTLLSGKSLLQNENFRPIYKTAGTHVDAGILINYDYFAGYISGELTAEGVEILFPGTGGGGWSALDLSLKSDAVSLNGFTVTDSIAHFLNRFSAQKPQNIEMTRILPASLNSFLWYGLSHVSGWIDNGGPKKYSSAFSWIENELATVTVPATRGNGRDEFFHYNIFRAGNPAGVLEVNWYSSIASGSDTAGFFYEDFRIKRIPVSSAIFTDAFGKWFGNVGNPYVFTLGAYVIMAENPAAARFFIDQYNLERTLGRDEAYKSFSENLSAEANLFIYTPVESNMSKLLKLTNDSLSAELNRNSEIYSRFESAALQLTRTGNKFYTSFFIRYNPSHKESRSTMWEATLEAPMVNKPWLVINHYDKTREIFLQDSLNNIYLFDNKGKLLWKQQIDGRIRGDVKQVDAFKNGKLQLIFNTDEKVFLTDRNGNTVAPFPITLPSKATAPLAVFDYDNNLDYRIMIPLSDNKIYNFDIRGTRVEGFNRVQASDIIDHPVLHTAISGKDYIIFADRVGKVYTVDRRGETRINLREKLPEGFRTLCVDKGRDLSTTYLITADSLGRVYRLSLADVPAIIKTGDYHEAFRFVCADIDRDGVMEYLYSDNNGLGIFGNAGNKLFNPEIAGRDFTTPQIFNFPDGLGRIGVVDTTDGQLYLINPDGQIAEGFPVKGYSSFAIGDLNRDNRLNLVTAGPGKTVFVYNLKD